MRSLLSVRQTISTGRRRKNQPAARMVCPLLLWLWGSLGLLLSGSLPSIALAQPESGEITAQAIREHIEYLADPAREGRRNAGKVAAREYICAAFESAGLTPLFDGQWMQEVPARTGILSEEGQIGQNLGAFVPGTDPDLRREWIIINAHYDHLGTLHGKVFPGADDNASGVSMLLEVARQISRKPLKRSVAFVAFDFEESLLWGSRWFIGHTPMHLDQIKLCLTADMIGRSLGGLGIPSVFVLGAEHSAILRETLAEISPPEGLEIAQLGTDMIGTRSDYGPFRDQEIPFLFFSTGQHPEYHTPRDTVDLIDFEKTARISQLILKIVEHLGNNSASLEWEPAAYQKLEEARAIYRVTDQLLQSEESGDASLSATQRFLVSQIRSKAQYMLKMQHVSDEERKWMGRSAQVLLLSVF